MQVALRSMVQWLTVCALTMQPVDSSQWASAWGPTLCLSTLVKTSPTRAKSLAPCPAVRAMTSSGVYYTGNYDGHDNLRYVYWLCHEVNIVADAQIPAMCQIARFTGEQKNIIILSLQNTNSIIFIPSDREFNLLSTRTIY